MVRTKNESVSGHRRRDRKGHWVRVGSFKRRPKLKRIKRIHRIRIMHRIWNSDVIAIKYLIVNVNIIRYFITPR